MEAHKTFMDQHGDAVIGAVLGAVFSIVLVVVTDAIRDWFRESRKRTAALVAIREDLCANQGALMHITRVLEATAEDSITVSLSDPTKYLPIANIQTGFWGIIESSQPRLLLEDSEFLRQLRFAHIEALQVNEAIAIRNAMLQSLLTDPTFDKESRLKDSEERLGWQCEQLLRHTEDHIDHIIRIIGYTSNPKDFSPQSRLNRRILRVFARARSGLLDLIWLGQAKRTEK